MSLVWLDLVWFGLIVFDSVGFSSIRFGMVRLGLVSFGSVQCDLVWFGLVRLIWSSSVGCGSVRSCSIRFSVDLNHLSYLPLIICKSPTSITNEV